MSSVIHSFLHTSGYMYVVEAVEIHRQSKKQLCLHVYLYTCIMYMNVYLVSLLDSPKHFASYSCDCYSHCLSCETLKLGTSKSLYI